MTAWMRHQNSQSWRSLRWASWVGLAGALMYFSVAVFSAGLFNPSFGTGSPLATVTISGHVRNVNQRGLKDESVLLLNQDDLSTIATTKTDSAGAYSFPPVTSGLNYTVKPNDSRVSSWLPSDTRDYPNLTQNVTNADFESHFPSFTVAGFVKNGAGTGLQGVKVRLSGLNLTTVDLAPTSANGSYTSPQLNILGDYTFTPQTSVVGGV